MDKIILKNLCFYGYNGVLEQEKILGQKFFVDVVLYLDLQKAGSEDSLDDTVNYGEVYQLIDKVFKEERYDLIEAVAETICNRVLVSFDLVKEIEVTIRKPEAPVPGIYDYFAVEIRRKRNA